MKVREHETSPCTLFLHAQELLDAGSDGEEGSEEEQTEDGELSEDEENTGDCYSHHIQAITFSAMLTQHNSLTLSRIVCAVWVQSGCLGVLCTCKGVLASCRTC